MKNIKHYKFIKNVKTLDRILNYKKIILLLSDNYYYLKNVIFKLIRFYSMEKDNFSIDATS